MPSAQLLHRWRAKARGPSHLCVLQHISGVHRCALFKTLSLCELLLLMPLLLLLLLLRLLLLLLLLSDGLLGLLQ